MRQLLLKLSVMERWQSGRMRLTRNQLYSLRVPGVRISLSPPYILRPSIKEGLSICDEEGGKFELPEWSSEQIVGECNFKKCEAYDAKGGHWFCQWGIFSKFFFQNGMFRRIVCLFEEFRPVLLNPVR